MDTKELMINVELVDKKFLFKRIMHKIRSEFKFDKPYHELSLFNVLYTSININIITFLDNIFNNFSMDYVNKDDGIISEILEIIYKSIDNVLSTINTIDKKDIKYIIKLLEEDIVQLYFLFKYDIVNLYNIVSDTINRLKDRDIITYTLSVESISLLDDINNNTIILKLSYKTSYKTCYNVNKYKQSYTFNF